MTRPVPPADVPTGTVAGEVLLQLDAARTNARAEATPLAVGLVVFDAARSCAVRLQRSTAPRAGTRIVPLESLDTLAGRRPRS